MAEFKQKRSQLLQIPAQGAEVPMSERLVGRSNSELAASLCMEPELSQEESELLDYLEQQAGEAAMSSMEPGLSMPDGFKSSTQRQAEDEQSKREDSENLEYGSTLECDPVMMQEKMYRRYSGPSISADRRSPSAAQESRRRFCRRSPVFPKQFPFVTEPNRISRREADQNYERCLRGL